MEDYTPTTEDHLEEIADWEREAATYAKAATTIINRLNQIHENRASVVSDIKKLSRDRAGRHVHLRVPVSEATQEAISDLDESVVRFLGDWTEGR